MCGLHGWIYIIHLGQILGHSKCNRNACCCHSYNIIINIIIFIILTPVFLSCYDTVILTDLLPLWQLLPILLPKLLQFYFTVTIGIPPILSSIIFSSHSNIFLQCSHLFLIIATFVLNIYFYSRCLLNPDLYEYSIVHQTSPQTSQLMSRTKLNIFLLSLVSPPVCTSQNITTIHLIELTGILGVIHNSSPCNQSLKSFDSTLLISLQLDFSPFNSAHHFQGPNWFSSYQTFVYPSANGTLLPKIKI